jgi:hypothetical protein
VTVSEFRFDFLPGIAGKPYTCPFVGPSFWLHIKAAATGLPSLTATPASCRYTDQEKSAHRTAYNKWQIVLQAGFCSEIRHVFSHPTGFLLCTDDGGKYTRKAIEEQLCIESTFHKITTADTPEQKSLREHINGTIPTHALAMLIDPRLPQTFCGYALETAAYPHCHNLAWLLKDSIQEAVWTQCGLLMIRLFCCIAYTLTPKDKGSGKFDSKAHKAIMIGYTPHKKVYCLMGLGAQKIFSSQHASLDETTTIRDSPRMSFLKMPAVSGKTCTRLHPEHHCSCKTSCWMMKITPSV